MEFSFVRVRRSDSPVSHLMSDYSDRETYCGRTAEQWLSVDPEAPELNCVKCAEIAALRIMGDR